jgi:hypothetical protein
VHYLPNRKRFFHHGEEVRGRASPSTKHGKISREPFGIFRRPLCFVMLQQAFSPFCERWQLAVVAEVIMKRPKGGLDFLLMKGLREMTRFEDVF